MYAQPAMFVPGNLNLEFGKIINDKHTRNAGSDIKGKYCVKVSLLVNKKSQPRFHISGKFMKYHINGESCKYS